MSFKEIKIGGVDDLVSVLKPDMKPIRIDDKKKGKIENVRSKYTKHVEYSAIFFLIAGMISLLFYFRDDE